MSEELFDPSVAAAAEKYSVTSGANRALFFETTTVAEPVVLRSHQGSIDLYVGGQIQAEPSQEQIRAAWGNTKYDSLRRNAVSTKVPDADAFLAVKFQLETK